MKSSVLIKQKENIESLEERLENRNYVAIIFSLLAFIFFVLLMVSLSINSDNIDIDDDLGPRMCWGLNLTFDSYYYYYELNGPDKIKIYCREYPEINEEELVDGFLILKK